MVIILIILYYKVLLFKLSLITLNRVSHAFQLIDEDYGHRRHKLNLY
jgi:hypothetical protein